jgi:hypothetical protein
MATLIEYLAHVHKHVSKRDSLLVYIIKNTSNNWPDDSDILSEDEMYISSVL